MKRAACLPTALVYVLFVSVAAENDGRTDRSIGVGVQTPRLQGQQQGCSGQHPKKSACPAQAERHDGRHDAYPADGPFQHTTRRDTAATATAARALQRTQHASLDASPGTHWRAEDGRQSRARYAICHELPAVGRRPTTKGKSRGQSLCATGSWCCQRQAATSGANARRRACIAVATRRKTALRDQCRPYTEHAQPRTHERNVFEDEFSPYHTSSRFVSSNRPQGCKRWYPRSSVCCLVHLHVLRRTRQPCLPRRSDERHRSHVQRAHSQHSLCNADKGSRACTRTSRGRWKKEEHAIRPRLD
jgi:hypothetical protein